MAAIWLGEFNTGDAEKASGAGRRSAQKEEVEGKAMGRDVSHETYSEVCRFYYKEARLFSEQDYRQWLDAMVDKSIVYFLPIFEERYRRDRKAEPEFPPFIYNDDFSDLDQRIQQLETDLARRIDPAGRIRHLITNIEAFEGEAEGEISTYSNFLICRNRREREQTILVGGREDRLIKGPDGLRIAYRMITIPQRVILDSDLYYMM
ncbi:aromatic-ring-hydroxylating dioxygenase subunit beta [Brevundimonas guildfordensis]|uniref:Aromatic-ring-hydroxylating dioxygenase subunit beta n=1 Tax=Brevundimonas guildfordensis TaxID=2762241 RepID=A0ABR8QWP0_9CAUL|nr:aromatic-ring-hydroxylating dioxygenase subunit beta [Brevundimonas guildfordensis]MBD7939946.1 aromatic-ring-hydroxylating dioxygenase subunit beta [Brevundimonas guildfordensis]